MVLTGIAVTARPVLDAEREEFRQLYLAGRFAQARRLAERCYEAGRDRVAWVHNLASVAYEQGNLREAYSLYLTHAELLPDCEDDYAVANFHLSFGLVCKRLGQLHDSEEYFDRAAIAYTAASESFGRAGAQACVGYAENALANLYVAWDRPSDAFEHVDKAQLLFNEAGEFARAAVCEDTRALAYEAQGRFIDAFECAARAVAILERCGAAEAKYLGQARETLERVYVRMKGETSTDPKTF